VFIVSSKVFWCECALTLVKGLHHSTSAQSASFGVAPLHDCIDAQDATP
jgi:hypothetical protein